MTKGIITQHRIAAANHRRSLGLNTGYLRIAVPLFMVQSTLTQTFAGA